MKPSKEKNDDLVLRPIKGEKINPIIGWICPVCGLGNSPYNYGTCLNCRGSRPLEVTF